MTTKLASRLRLAKAHLTSNGDYRAPCSRPGDFMFICHAIQLGLYKEPEGLAFHSNPELPETVLLVEMGMPLTSQAFFELEPNERQTARFMLLEFAALLAEDTEHINER